jgi:G3E family GTPase
LRFLGELKDAGKGADTVANESSTDLDPTQGAYLGGRLPPRHDPAVKTLSLRFETPFTWASFSAATETLLALRGKDLLRVKGIINVEGQPVVVQGVGHIFHPPVTLDRWPSADTGSRIVFIARHLDAAAVQGLFQATSALQG